MSAVSCTTTCTPHRVSACCDDAIRKDESIHLRIRLLVPEGQNAAIGIREPRDVIYRDRVQWISRPGVDDQKQSAPGKVLPADVVHDNVVNAKSGSCLGGRPGLFDPRGI